MRKPSVAKTKGSPGFVGAWGRFGWSFRWQDPPFWRFPRVETHTRGDARGVLIGWRYTGLFLVWLGPTEEARESTAAAQDIFRGVRESGAAFDRAVIKAWTGEGVTNQQPGVATL